MNTETEQKEVRAIFYDGESKTAMKIIRIFDLSIDNKQDNNSIYFPNTEFRYLYPNNWVLIDEGKLRTLSDEDFRAKYIIED